MLSSLSIDRLRPLHYALLALFCFFLYLPGQSSLPPTDRDESRFAQASKQMAETGDVIDIHFQEEHRYKKPIGIYWLQSASTVIASAITGSEPNAIWTYRIPSLLAAIGVVLMIAALGARLFTPAIGLTAALIMASTLMLNVEARLAKTDATLLLTIVTAQYALITVWLRRGASPKHTWLFWMAMGAGTLIKGPIILIPTISTLAVLCWRERSAQFLKSLRPARGLALYLLIVLPWLVIITLKSGGAFWGASVGHDLMGKVASGQESHAMPPLYYTAVFWATFWPGSILAFLAIPFVWRERKQEKITLLLAWLLPMWVIFELIPTKLPHYVLPTYPAIALLTAAALHTDFRTYTHRWISSLGWAVWGVIAAGLTLGAAMLPQFASAPLMIKTIVIALVALALLIWWATQINSKNRQLHIAILPLVGFLALAPIFCMTLPSLDRVWIARQVKQATQDAGCRAPQLASGGFHEPSLVFTVGTDIQLDVNGTQAATFLQDNRAACTFVLLDETRLPDFTAEMNRLSLPILHVAVIEGFNYARGKPVKLQLLGVVTSSLESVE